MTPLHDVAVSAPHQLSVEFVEHAEFVLGATFVEPDGQDPVRTFPVSRLIRP